MHQPTLEALYRRPSGGGIVDSALGDSARVAKAEQLECFDFFCGCGGWSEGSAQAGHRIVYACDSDADALAVHEANHPDATHVCAKLPMALCQLPFPTDGRPFHVHGSPPCTTFSTMNSRSGGTALAAGRKRATRLVRWFLKTALSSGCTSWTMEQVASPVVLAVVERVRLANRSKMDYGIFEFRDLGVPQTRKRLLAGTPALIARLRRLQAHSRRRSVRDVLTHARGTHVRSSLRWEKARLRHRRAPGESKYVYVASPDPMHASHPVTGPAPTVVTTGPLKWVSKGVAAQPTLTVKELAALQTFPPTYELPDHQKTGQLLVGNAVPPLVARLLMS